MKKWLLQTISEILDRSTLHERSYESEKTTKKITIVSDRHHNGNGRRATAQLQADREWSSARSALEKLLLQVINSDCNTSPECQGLVLSGPAPILSTEKILSQVHRGVFAPEASSLRRLMPCQQQQASPTALANHICPVVEFPLLSSDPLATEQFALIFTSSFALVMSLGKDSTDTPKFEFSFDPEVVYKAWTALRGRLLLTSAHQLSWLDSLVEKYAPTIPDYRLVMEFSRQAIAHLSTLPELEEKRLTKVWKTHPEETPAKVISLRDPKDRKSRTSCEQQSNCSKKNADVELLQALTHEIRTPLTTIRMLTRLLLKKPQKLTQDAIKRLENIDRECTEQINRMELIFRAAELETTTATQPKKEVPLTSISLEQLFQQNIPCWQKQAQRRNVTLDFILPEKLPTVVTNPSMLEQVLIGLMEKFTRNSPSGGEIQVQVTTAGNQLKLELQSYNTNNHNPIKSIGQLLMFQPETGSLSLNLDVTKNLFHALGGKLTVRQRPQQGEVMTIFLPLGNTNNSQVNSQTNFFLTRSVSS
ncbi:MAG: HAMP domain-containing sensor histidine kinase [Oscillatoria sp. PMC 1051.18]|nr:HAMP domain-containing sensor histidine kinase [Oscillatoria sp. PMC 1050.18]MEC5030016.1 HAMP domain-containing sensor histidine kinase [Oscillatoria sp. PMC 1051.18]